MHWSQWPQILAILLLFVGFGLKCRNFGTWQSHRIGFDYLLVIPALNIAILYFGGFFAAIGWAP